MEVNEASGPGAKRRWGWLAALLGLDLFFILLHMRFGWSLINLDEEANLTTWYSSVKLLALGALCVLIFSRERRMIVPVMKWPWLWLLVAGVFLFLSADETASIHERFARFVTEETEAGLDIRETVLGGDAMKSSFAWVFLLAPFIGGVALFFLLFFAARLRRHRVALGLALAGLGCFLLAVGLESTIYATPALSEWTADDVARYQFWVGIEESGEVFGSTLFLLSFLSYSAFLRPGPPPPGRIASA
jgi:hypothetical protein